MTNNEMIPKENNSLHEIVGTDAKYAVGNPDRRKKKKRIILIIVLIVIAVFAASSVYSHLQARKAGASEPQAQTEEVIQTTLTSSISATGVLKSKHVTNLVATAASETGLKVTSVNVRVGDLVEPGDEICTFDVSNAKEQLKAAKDAQAKAKAAEEANRRSAQRSYDQAVASKERQLSAAQNEIDEAYSQIGSAQEALKAIDADVLAAQQEVEEKKKLLEAAESEEEIERTEAALGSAKEDLATVKGEQSELAASVSSAEATYRQAQATYEQTAAEADEAIASAKDTLDAGTYDSGDDGGDQSAEIRALQEAVDGEVLRASAAGTVTAVNVSEGGYYTGGPAVTIQDTESLYVVSNIKEADIADVKEGMRVLIKTDATEDKEFEGKVLHVAPTAGTGNSGEDSDYGGLAEASSGGNASYLVEIDLLQSSDRLRVDMTAKLSLIKEQHKNILAVPYDAIFTDDAGNKTLHVLKDQGEAAGDTLSAEPEGMTDGTDGIAAGEKDGKKKGIGLKGGKAGAEESEEPAYTEVPVETGMESGYYVEILPTDGIQKGTVILMPSVENAEGEMMDMDAASGL